MADKLVNFFMAIIQVIILIWIFKLNIIPPSNLLLFFPILINSILISYFINLILSFIGFWTTEVWPIRFIFITLLFFLSGNYFPLDIMPEPIYKLILATPFPYMFYLPTKLLVNNQSTINNLPSLIFYSYLWVIGSYLVAKSVWKSGNKSFSFWGRWYYEKSVQIIFYLFEPLSKNGCPTKGWNYPFHSWKNLPLYFPTLDALSRF